jgi:hypothetical protein
MGLAFPPSFVGCWLGGLVTFGVPFVLFYRLILYHFYVSGSFMGDAGQIASLIWHHNKGWLSRSDSFFRFHVSPVLALASAISNFLPVTRPQMLAGFIGVSHGLLAVSVYWLLVDGYGIRRGWGLLLSVNAAMGFGCCGLAMAIALYPHFELFGAACLLLTLIGLALRRYVVAGLAFTFALATREDIGLHAFGFLLLWLVANRIRGVMWREDRWLVGFAAAGATYSVTAMALQHVAFPGQSSFFRVYVGDPAFAHLSTKLVMERALGWLWVHNCILIPAATVVLWTAFTGTWLVLIGYGACLPWAILHLIAAWPLAGWMVAYYGFPFIIALAWPLLAGVILRGSGPVTCPQTVAPAAAMLALVVLGSMPLGQDYNPGRIPVPAAFIASPSETQQAAVDQTIARLAAQRDLLGPFAVDYSVVALAPDEFPADEVIDRLGAVPHTAIFLVNGFKADIVRELPGLPSRYAVPGTSVRIATDRPEAVQRALGTTSLQPDF